MKLSVETYLQSEGREDSEALGRTTLSIGDQAYLELAQLESELQQGDARETVVDMDEQPIEVNGPEEVGALKERRLRVYLDEQNEVGHFHLMAKRASDDALVYTEPAMIRLVAL